MKRLIILLGIFFWSGSILLSAPLTQEEKQEIIQEEWQGALEPAKKPYKKYPRKEREEKVIKKVIREEKLKAIPSLKEVIPEKFEKPIILKAGQVPLKDVLGEISRMAGVETIIEKDVDTTQLITTEIDNLSVATALRVILSPLGYSFEMKKDRLRVYAFDTKMFKIVLPSLKQNYSSTITNEAISKEKDEDVTTTEEKGVRLGAKITVSSKIEDSSLWEEMDGNIKNMLSEKGKYTINTVAGMITVTDYGLVLEKIGKYIDLVNQELSKQIFVKAKIVEVALNKDSAYGIDWDVIKERFAFTSNFALSNITGAMAVLTPRTAPGAGTTIDGVSAVIRALKTEGEVKVISQPQTMTLNNQPVVIQVGNIQSYVSKVKTETTTWGTSFSVDTADVQEGVILSLCGRIMDDGTIYLNVSPVITSLKNLRTIKYGTTTIEAPETSSRAMNTTVRIKDGDTIIVGGLISQDKIEREQRIPILGSIPLLGYLFRSRQKEDTKTEIVIFLTTEIVT